jgi:hypothetical protein
MRSLLGDMWDKYETFNLCLNIITTEASLVDSQTTGENDRNLLVYKINSQNPRYPTS